MIRFPSRQEYEVMKVIHESPEEAYGASICVKLDLLNTSIYKPIQSLQSKGLIERAGSRQGGANGSAREAFLYRLTPVGKALYDVCERFRRISDACNA